MGTKFCLHSLDTNTSVLLPIRYQYQFLSPAASIASTLCVPKINRVFTTVNWYVSCDCSMNIVFFLGAGQSCKYILTQVHVYSDINIGSGSLRRRIFQLVTLCKLQSHFWESNLLLLLFFYYLLIMYSTPVTAHQKNIKSKTCKAKFFPVEK